MVKSNLSSQKVKYNLYCSSRQPFKSFVRDAPPLETFLGTLQSRKEDFWGGQFYQQSESNPGQCYVLCCLPPKSHKNIPKI